MHRLEPRRLFAAYALIDLGTLGGDASYGHDINNSDVAVGYARTAAGAERAFRFADANRNGIADPGEMQDLGVLPGHNASQAFGINDAGVAVGTSKLVSPGAESVDTAVLFSSGGVTDLALGAGSNALAVNTAGDVVGGATFDERYSAFVRSADGTITQFANNPVYSSSEARGINDDGVIVGYASGGSGDVGFVRTPDGTTSVVSFPQPASLYSYAWDVNASGEVAGEGFDSAGRYSAFRYEPDRTVTALGTLEGYASSQAAGINVAGEVVGRAVSESGGRQRAVLYSGDVLYDLNDLIPANSGWRLTDARAINDHGSIVGFGTAPDGRTRAFQLKRTADRVRSRFVFYNNSAFDGHDPAPNAADNSAVAFNKQPLLSGATASSANYTSFSRGINGVLLDLVRPDQAAAPTAADFEFRTGNDSNAAGWAPAPAPSSVTVRPGGGLGGSDRVTVVWPDGAIKNTWLQITVKANSRTGLPQPDVFYFGNLVGETANRSSRAEVGYADVVRTRLEFSREPVGLSSRYDHNRDGRIDTWDVLIVRRNFGRSLALIAPPAAAASASITLGASAALLGDEQLK